MDWSLEFNCILIGACNEGGKWYIDEKMASCAKEIVKCKKLCLKNQFKGKKNYYLLQRDNASKFLL